MIIRTITSSTNPATQCTLYYTNMESYLSKSEKIEANGGGLDCLIVADDFGQQAEIRVDLIASDMISDNAQSFGIKANQKLDELNASKMFEQYLRENPALEIELKELDRRKALAQQPPMGMLPPNLQHGGKKRR